MSDLSLLPKDGLEAVLRGQVPGPHIAIFAAGDERVAARYESLHASTHAHMNQRCKTCSERFWFAAVLLDWTFTGWPQLIFMRFPSLALVSPRLGSNEATDAGLRHSLHESEKLRHGVCTCLQEALPGQ